MKVTFYPFYGRRRKVTCHVRDIIPAAARDLSAANANAKNKQNELEKGLDETQFLVKYLSLDMTLS